MVREKNGRYPKGVSGNPKGRPKRSTEERLLAVMADCVTNEDWRDITNRAVERAKKGDPNARTWLSSYLLGTPKQSMELTGADGRELVFRVVYDD